MQDRLILAFSGLVLPAVVGAADVRVDYDRHKDFRQYRTFSVEVGPLVRSDGVVDEQNTLAETRLRQAVTRELQARGLEPTDQGADVMVQVSGRESERTLVIDDWGWGHNPWRRRWGYWGYPHRYWGGPYGPVAWTRRYLEESLLVDVIERETGALLYRARVTDEVGDDLEKRVPKVMAKAFKKFPVKERSG